LTADLEIGNVSVGLDLGARKPMKSRRHTSLMRRAATFAAIILLIGQAIAAAHFHRASVNQEISAGASAGTTDSACAICVAHLHSPGVSGIAPAIDVPSLLEKLVTLTVLSRPSLIYAGHRFGRAPPASV
jgi:hypothetical protein